ncbi:uncharacterized protein LOC131927130 isoform X2 [Physella acuta]|nr:uncharacterized protein LOC131927130 isoform X2 [Physella acuta]XP_059138783.1 uncharacterized protein LOC131927130 isoform X2 [Physella acuta]
MFCKCMLMKNQQRYGTSVDPCNFTKLSTSVTDTWTKTVTVSLPQKHNPGKNLPFRISVLDTFPGVADENKPTVVAIHGVPNTGKVYQSLATQLYNKGIRLVAPTTFGMEFSQADVKHISNIDFTTTNRAYATQQVLKELNIKKIDVLVGHSAGSWVVYEAGANWDNVGALICVNPTGATANRGMRPEWFMKSVAYLLLIPWCRWLLMPIVKRAYNALFDIREVSLDNDGAHLIACQQYITHQQYERVPINANKIREKKIPIVMMYSLNDRLVETSICSDMADKYLQIPKENKVMFADDKTSDKDPCFVPNGWFSKSLVFARGGHIVHIAHEAELVQQIEHVIKQGSKKRCFATK